VRDFDPQDFVEHLSAAFAAAAPHLVAAGRELLAAGEAFVEALTDETTAGRDPAERIVVED
jgi:hypothetical protein